jgi:hypothetical protein
MNLTIAHIMLLLMPSSVVMAQHRLVVVNVESKVPIRDVRVCTDNGQEVRTSCPLSVQTLTSRIGTFDSTLTTTSLCCAITTDDGINKSMICAMVKFIVDTIFTIISEGKSRQSRSDAQTF